MKGVWALSDLLIINMFSEFSISYGDVKLTDKVVHSKKGWLLLAYLITFRHRDISQNELIELLWPNDELENPANTLKGLLHRVRAILKTLGYEDAKTLILSHGGTYAWNTAVPAVVDTDVFETLYQEAYGPDVAESVKLEKLLAAVKLYQGDFLLTYAMDAWVVSISTHYHGQYLKMVSDGCKLLFQNDNFQKLGALCQQAIQIDPYEEFLHFYLLKAMANLGKQQQALAYYDYVENLFFSKFSINLSPEMVALYKELAQSLNSVTTDLQMIRGILQEPEVSDGSFCCGFEIFMHIYRLEARSAVRTGQVVHLVLFTMQDLKEQLPEQQLLNKSMDKLHQVIEHALRSGDVFSRYSACQYLLMLPMTTFESATLVIDRITKLFYRKNPNLEVVIKHSLQAVSPNAPKASSKISKIMG